MASNIPRPRGMHSSCRAFILFSIFDYSSFCRSSQEFPIPRLKGLQYVVHQVKRDSIAEAVEDPVSLSLKAHGRQLKTVARRFGNIREPETAGVRVLAGRKITDHSTEGQRVLRDGAVRSCNHVKHRIVLQS